MSNLEIALESLHRSSIEPGDYMDFEFKTFSPRSFERFAQAMALHTLGNGVMVFGDGPDGGREAAYEGSLNFPASPENWSGYTIMQAKFLQVPGSPHEDADWLVAQLRAELSKFTKPDSKLRKPEYYILVSNARLSPMPENDRAKGGIAKIDEVFAEFKDELKLKDYRVWHLDQLCTMLINADSLRRSYAAWLSTSDVIADLLAQSNARTASIKDGMYRYLARELRSHQPIRLQQAGHSGNSQTMIEDVFVDLPFRKDRQRRRETSKKLLLATLLDQSRDCLDGASVTAQQDQILGRPERILILGGPGQGKSTLSQFLAQIFRANILKSNNTGNNTAEINTIINKTLKYAEDVNLSIDIPRRFPIRIDLPIFADWLSKRDKDQCTSLLDHIAGHITQISSTEICATSLREWFSNHPTVIILDGLDEVPSSANRSVVLRAVNEFWDEASQADLLMVVTTRPQGYNDDLDPKLYTKLELVPLRPEQAIEYANKLAGALLVDTIQRDRVLERIADAAASKTTARLLVSPLQVAILISLIDQRGDAPTDRWSLFDKYFGVMLQREQGKLGRVGEVMRHWSRQISAIHYRAGFLLHVEAETLGHSEPQLTSNDLEALVRGQLEDEGYEGNELHESIRALIEVSTERMVLLVQNAEDRFTFEVRSLQEFMAAAYVMSGRESTVQKRLKAIANKTHWLHVFQIAASKCFAENDSVQYRDTIVTICRDINENGDEIDRLLKTGSSLALALLDDGIAYDQPKYRRMLLAAAFEILRSGPTILPESLSDHCDREPLRTAELLRNYIGNIATDTVDAAWRLLIYCHISEQEWTETFIKEVWQEESTHLVKLILTPAPLPANSTLLKKLREKLSTTPFALIKHHYDSTLHNGARFQAVTLNFPCLRVLSHNSHKRKNIKISLDGQEIRIQLQYCPLEIGDHTKSTYDSLPETVEWAPIQELRNFHENPNKESLSNLISLIEANDWKDIFESIVYLLPWPLGTAVHMAATQQSYTTLYKDIFEGKFGDIQDWRQAEERWSNKGIEKYDFDQSSIGKLFDQNVALMGWPLSQPMMNQDFNKPSLYNEIAQLVHAAVASPRRLLSHLLEAAVASEDDNLKLPLEVVKLLYGTQYHGQPNQPWIDPRLLTKLDDESFENIPFLESLDAACRKGNVWIPPHGSEPTRTYDLLIKKSDFYPGLIIALINLIAGDVSQKRYQIENKIQDLSMLTSEPLIEECLKVVNFVYDSGKIDGIVNSLEKATVHSQHLPSWILKSCLENDRLNSEKRLELMEIIAGEMNQNPKLPRDFFITEMNSASRIRRADLHLPDYWLELEFCDSLQKLSSLRRAKVSKFDEP